jgi:hypothetical protein
MRQNNPCSGGRSNCRGQCRVQAEFSLTHVLDQPVTGRIFFEEVIRENLDIGRPSQVSRRPRSKMRLGQAPVMQFRSLIGPAIVRSFSKPSPVPRMVTVP